MLNGRKERVVSFFIFHSKVQFDFFNEILHDCEFTLGTSKVKWYLSFGLFGIIEKLFIGMVVSKQRLGFGVDALF